MADEARQAIDHFKKAGGTEEQLTALLDLQRTAAFTLGWLRRAAEKDEALMDLWQDLMDALQGSKAPFYGRVVDPAEVADELYSGDGF